MQHQGDTLRYKQFCTIFQNHPSHIQTDFISLVVLERIEILVQSTATDDLHKIWCLEKCFGTRQIQRIDLVELHQTASCRCGQTCRSD